MLVTTVTRIWRKKTLLSFCFSGYRGLQSPYVLFCSDASSSDSLGWGRKTHPESFSFSCLNSLPVVNIHAPASFRSLRATKPVDYLQRYCFSSQSVGDLSACGIVDVPLAQTGEGIAECELLKWFVQEGDQVEEFEPICEVQSDKATIEITSRYKGKVSQILYVPGDVVKVGETLVKMEVGNSQVTTENDGDIKNTKPPDFEFKKAETSGVLSTPSTRNIAKQHGIDIKDVHGTGKDGRISKEDVIRYAVQNGIVRDPSSFLSVHSEEKSSGEDDNDSNVVSNIEWSSADRRVPIRGYQRAMVKSMSIAAKIPHFHYVDEINCEALVELKTSFQSNSPYPDIKYSFLPLLIKSLSMAMIKYPMMNSCFSEESMEVIFKGSHNIGIAMATSHGLVVPNIKNVQSLSILEITKEISRLHKLASNNKLNPGDLSDGTITLSNIGAIGGKFGSPLVNIPEVSIIALGRIQKVAHFDDEGNVYPVSIMTVNVGADHRVLDGATVARFCNEWKQLIENPELLLLHMR